MYRAGIDLGGTNIKAGIVDENQKIAMQTSAPTGAERSAEEVIADMAGLVKQLMEELKIDESALAGIGVGCPGLVDAEAGIVRYSNNISWENVALVQELGKYFSCGIRISNDANCAALGEVKAGAAKDVSNAILLTLGTGVGGGIILNGKVFEGSNAGGAELGHISMIMGGEPCTWAPRLCGGVRVCHGADPGCKAGSGGGQELPHEPDVRGKDREYEREDPFRCSARGRRGGEGGRGELLYISCGGDRKLCQYLPAGCRAPVRRDLQPGKPSDKAGGGAPEFSVLRRRQGVRAASAVRDPRQ